VSGRFVSVGISFYNAAGTLGDAIRSVFAQTHAEWELLLIDDGSTDRSREIAQSIDELGFDSIITSDHFYSATLTSSEAFDAVAQHTAMAMETNRVTCNCFMYAVGYRHPAVLASAVILLTLSGAARNSLRRCNSVRCEATGARLSVQSSALSPPPPLRPANWA